LSRRLRIPLSLMAAAVVMFTALLSFLGRSNSHVEMLSVAIVGLAAGERRRDRLVDTMSSPLLLVPTYLIYLALITVFDVPYLLQVVGACLSALVVYAIGAAWSTSGAVQRYIVALGQYSLLSYIVQIAALQLMRHTLRGVALSSVAILVPLAAGIVVTSCVVESAVRLREKSPAFDRSYRFVFA